MTMGFLQCAVKNYARCTCTRSYSVADEAWYWPISIPCTLHGCLTSRPAGLFQPRELVLKTFVYSTTDEA